MVMPPFTPTVLVVDAWSDQADTYADALNVPGWTIVTVAAPRQAYRIVLRGGVDVIVTRIEQPLCTTSGIELTRHVKRNSRTRHLPVVVVTTLTDPAFHDAALRAGCDAYVLLPVAPDELRAEIECVLRQRTSQPVSSPA